MQSICAILHVFNIRRKDNIQCIIGKNLKTWYPQAGDLRYMGDPTSKTWKDLGSHLLKCHVLTSRWPFFKFNDLDPVNRAFYCASFVQLGSSGNKLWPFHYQEWLLPYPLTPYRGCGKWLRSYCCDLKKTWHDLKSTALTISTLTTPHSHIQVVECYFKCLMEQVWSTLGPRLAKLWP